MTRAICSAFTPGKEPKIICDDPAILGDECEESHPGYQKCQSKIGSKNTCLGTLGGVGYECRYVDLSCHLSCHISCHTRSFIFPLTFSCLLSCRRCGDGWKMTLDQDSGEQVGINHTFLSPHFIHTHLFPHFIHTHLSHLAPSQSCEDINECLELPPSKLPKDCTGPRSACINTLGGFNCTGPLPNKCTDPAFKNNGCWVRGPSPVMSSPSFSTPVSPSLSHSLLFSLPNPLILLLLTLRWTLRSLSPLPAR